MSPDHQDIGVFYPASLYPVSNPAPLPIPQLGLRARWPRDHPVYGSTRGLGHVAANPISLGIEW